MSLVSIDLTSEAQAALNGIERFAGAAPQAIARGLDKGANLALGVIQRERYTGQGPFDVSEHRLGVKTNRLRSSLRWSKAVINGADIAGSMGSNVVYAGVHEYGSNATAQVKSFERKVSPSQFTKKGGGLTKEQRRTKASREAALGRETVRAHSRVMNMPARAPLTAGLVETAPLFSQEIGNALLALWERLKGGAS